MKDGKHIMWHFVLFGAPYSQKWSVSRVVVVGHDQGKGEDFQMEARRRYGLPVVTRGDADVTEI